MVSSKPYTLKRVDKLPLRARVSTYDDLVRDIQHQGTGIYEVNIPNKKTRSVYTALIKRVKGTNIKLHLIKGKLYAEVK